MMENLPENPTPEEIAEKFKAPLLQILKNLLMLLIGLLIVSGIFFNGLVVEALKQ